MIRRRRRPGRALGRSIDRPLSLTPNTSSLDLLLPLLWFAAVAFDSAVDTIRRTVRFAALLAPTQPGYHRHCPCLVYALDGGDI